MRTSDDLERASPANGPREPAAAVRPGKGVPEDERSEDLVAMAGEIAHDFNNILLSIEINAELLLAGETEDGLAARRLGQILEAARRGRDRARELTALARQAKNELRPRETPPVSAGQADPLPRGTEHVLVVDDEEIQVQAMSRLLGSLGYTAVGLTDPVEALQEFRRDPGAYDLVITDQTMPPMSGAELATEILRIRPGTPMIMCTGFRETVDEDEAMAIGIRAFMLKPFSVKEIAAMIRRVLRSET